MFNERQLGEFIAQHFHRRAFRLEVRDRYAVASDGGDYARYLAGEDAPDPARKNAWLNKLRSESAAGKTRQWVHVVRSPLSDYLRYEFEWGYAVNIRAGAQVKILDLQETPRPEEVPNEDFWLLDDEAVALMHYDADGRFFGAEPLDPRELPRYLRARELAWQTATPFDRYWQTHPAYHRAA